MAHELKPVDRVRRALAGIDGVTERRMFGSLGFLANGRLLGGVGQHDDRVMLIRVGAAADEALTRPGARPAVMRGRPMSGWLFLDRSAVATDQDVAHWVALGLAAIRASSEPAEPPPGG